MQYSVAALLAAAAGAQAFASSNISYTTEVVTAVTTYCPEATQFTHAGTTYTVSSATTLTITDCPCTITRPVTVSTSSECATVPTAHPYSNGTATFVTSKPTATGSSPSGAGSSTSGNSAATATHSSSTPIVTAGAGKTAALSGAGLAGILGLAAFVL